MWNLALKPLKTYLHYCKAFGHQTWQGGDLQCEAPTHKVAWTLIKCSYQITRQTKTILSLLPKCLWPQNLTWWWLTTMSYNSKSHMIFKSRVLVGSRDKLNIFCLNLHLTSGHQTRQGGDLLFGPSIDKVKQPLKMVVI